MGISKGVTATVTGVYSLFQKRNIKKNEKVGCGEVGGAKTKTGEVLFGTSKCFKREEG